MEIEAYIGGSVCVIHRSFLHLVYEHCTKKRSRFTSALDCGFPWKRRRKGKEKKKTRDNSSSGYKNYTCEIDNIKSTICIHSNVSRHFYFMNPKRIQEKMRDSRRHESRELSEDEPFNYKKCTRVEYETLLEDEVKNQKMVSIVSFLLEGFFSITCFCKSINVEPLWANNLRKLITDSSLKLPTARSACPRSYLHFKPASVYWDTEDDNNVHILKVQNDIVTLLCFYFQEWHHRHKIRFIFYA